MADGSTRCEKSHFAPDLSHRARASGLAVARRHAGRQITRVVEFLRTHGPATDQEISAAIGVALASVNSTRGTLVKRRVVEAAGVEPGPHGALRTRWRLR